RQGQGGLVHGGQDRLARRRAQQRTAATGGRRAARRQGESVLGARAQPSTGTAKASRDAFGEAILRLGETHSELVVLDADLSESTRSGKFAKKFPQRFFQMGISEADMIGAAAGLALGGKVPFCCSFAAF